MALSNGSKYLTDPSGIPIEDSSGSTRSLTGWVDGQTYTYKTVADMVADDGLTVGAKVRTLGYWSLGDGGGNDYEVVAAAGTDDGGSFIDLSVSGLQAKGMFTNGTKSARQYGAKGDGVTDDTTPLNNAILSVEDLPLVIPEGVYGITPPLLLSSTSGGEVFLEKRAVLKIISPPSTTDFWEQGAISVTGNNWVVHGGEIDGNKDEVSPGSFGVFVTGNDNSVKDMVVRDTAFHGMSIDGNALEGATNDKNDIGNYGLRNTIAGNKILDTGGVGISQFAAIESNICSNRVYRAGNEGITVDFYCQECVVENNHVVDSAQVGAVGGIGVDAAYNCVISNNTVKGTVSVPGITLQCEVDDTFSNTITGNTIANNGSYGIWLRYRDIIFPTTTGAFAQSDYNSITGNSFRENSDRPIRVDEQCTGNTISGNSYEGQLPSIDPASVGTSCTDAFVMADVGLSADQLDVTGDGTAYTVPFDTGDAGLFTAGVYTVPVTGRYCFTWSVRMDQIDSGHVFLGANLVTTVGTRFHNIALGTRTGVENVAGAASLYLAEGDTVKVEIKSSGSGKTIDVLSTTGDTYLSIVRVQ